MGLAKGLVRAYCRGPHYRGKIHIARWLANRLLPYQGLVEELADGTKLYLHPRDWIEYRLLQRGTYEPHTLEFLRRNLPPGSQGVFAGVNIGLHVIVASRAVGPQGRIVGVEPQPISLLRARENIVLNQLPDNVYLVSGGLGSRPGLLAMAPAPAHNSGMASFVAEQNEPCPFRVGVEPLPELLFRLELRRPALFLLDVEGYEADVLQGITPSSRPRIIVVEVKEDHLSRAGSSAASVFGRLAELGYAMFDLAGKPARPGEEVDEFNVVAVADDAPAIQWVAG